MQAIRIIKQSKQVDIEPCQGQRATTKVSDKQPISESPKNDQTQGTLASLPGFVPWHSQLAHTIPAKPKRKQATGIIHQPKQVDEGGYPYHPVKRKTTNAVLKLPLVTSEFARIQPRQMRQFCLG